MNQARRRHGLYWGLLLLSLVLVVLLALPGSIVHTRSHAYLVLTLLLAFGLPHSGWLFRGLGLVCAGAQWVWLNHAVADPLAGMVLLVVVILFISLSLHRLILCLAREPRVDGAVVAGATAGYLLLGLTGGLVLTLLDLSLSGSFRDSISGESVQLPDITSLTHVSPDWDRNFQRINYFAFVSLTTVGYGDITPSHPLVQLASVSLSVLGPLYIAVVMGVLISRIDLGRQASVDRSRPRVRRRRPFHAPARPDRGPGESAR